MPSFKENREGNRYRDVRDVRKNYEETIRQLSGKEEEVKGLKALVFEK